MSPPKETGLLAWAKRDKVCAIAITLAMLAIAPHALDGVARVIYAVKGIPVPVAQAAVEGSK